MIVRENGLNCSVLIIEYLGKLNISSVVDALTDLAVMVEKVPFPMIFNNGMMCGPSDNRLHQSAPVCKGSLRTCTCCIYKIMSCAG